MVYHDDLLDLAEHTFSLASGPGRPRQVYLRRSVSAAYYAVFHLLMHEATQVLQLPNVPERRRWRRVLGRRLDHAEMRKAASGIAASNVRGIGPVASPPDLQLVAEAFVDLQGARHRADYDLNDPLTKEEAEGYIDVAKEAFEAWARVRQDAAAQLFLHLLPDYEGLRT